MQTEEMGPQIVFTGPKCQYSVSPGSLFCKAYAICLWLTFGYGCDSPDHLGGEGVAGFAGRGQPWQKVQGICSESTDLAPFML